MPIDFRESLYALSDVIMNRPPPLRTFDQIYMKLPDMLLQAELIGRWFDKKDVVFIGDGDAIALTCVHLAAQGQLASSPKRVCVLDFDERVKNSINRFASTHALTDKIQAELYNVADPLPPQHWQQYDAFYCNPPWGKANHGSSVLAFIDRGIEAVKGNALGCIVIGDHKDRLWTHSVQVETQKRLLERGFRIAEMLPEFHHYHLDDDPELTSCSMIAERQAAVSPAYTSAPINNTERANFYGTENPLRIHYIRDLRNGGKMETRDIKTEAYEN